MEFNGCAWIFGWENWFKNEILELLLFFEVTVLAFKLNLPMPSFGPTSKGNFCIESWISQDSNTWFGTSQEQSLQNSVVWPRHAQIESFSNKKHALE